VISFIAYSFSNIFQTRVDSGLSDILNYNSNKNTSVGMRITFLINSFTLFLESPIFGVGAGDFPLEYERINEQYSPEVDLTVQPHNMYLLVLAQLGLIGLCSLASIFYLQFKIATLAKEQIILNIGIAMPILFLVIMWSDSYLLGHYTSNLFILFSAFIYSNNQSNDFQ
jgi:O-antigen ligase